MPRKPRCRNEFLAVQYTIGALGEAIEPVEVKTNEWAQARNNNCGPKWAKLKRPTLRILERAAPRFSAFKGGQLREIILLCGDGEAQYPALGTGHCSLLGRVSHPCTSQGCRFLAGPRLLSVDSPPGVQGITVLL